MQQAITMKYTAKKSLLGGIARRTFLILSVLVMAVSNSLPVSAEILVDKELVESGATQYDSRVSNNVCDDDGGTGNYGDVDRFLQVLADQESGGDPHAQSSISSASGKYQYIDGTWRARRSIYPPSGQYAHAKDAPEAVQDAVAYIEYSQKFVDFDGDIFKLAVSHFYPAANSNPALLDITPGGNSITPREYAESVMSKISEGVGVNIQLLYRQAPRFDEFNRSGAPAGESPTPNPGENPETPGDGKKVFLDPGHGAAVAEYTDRVTGLRDRETANTPESGDVLEVARRVESALETEGYVVTMSRSNNRTPVNKRVRVEAAKRADADIAVSIHTTPGNLNDVWAQKTGTYREYNGTRVEFTNSDTARTSQRYAGIFTRTRGESENRDVSTDSNNTHQSASFNRAGVPSKGNISLVQLWSPTIPWVYNEYGLGDDNDLSEQEKQKYATGIINGIRESLGGSGNTDTSGVGEDCVSPSGSNFAGGDFTETVLAYAWPQYHSAPYLRMTPSYKAAVIKSTREGIYNGGIAHDGIDCGGFVTLLMLNSGFEPGYNNSGHGGPTATQQAWAEAHWQKLGRGSSIDTGSLQPGDVAFWPGHTFVFVGRVNNFRSNIASASLDERAPMAGSESLTGSSTTWYRKR